MWQCAYLDYSWNPFAYLTAHSRTEITLLLSLLWVLPFYPKKRRSPSAEFFLGQKLPVRKRRSPSAEFSFGVSRECFFFLLLFSWWSHFKVVFLLTGGAECFFLLLTLRRILFIPDQIRWLSFPRFPLVYRGNWYWQGFVLGFICSACHGSWSNHSTCHHGWSTHSASRGV